MQIVDITKKLTEVDNKYYSTDLGLLKYIFVMQRKSEIQLNINNEEQTEISGHYIINVTRIGETIFDITYVLINNVGASYIAFGLVARMLNIFQ